jgi:hypothetical protein
VSEIVVAVVMPCSSSELLFGDAKPSRRVKLLPSFHLHPEQHYDGARIGSQNVEDALRATVGLSKIRTPSWVCAAIFFSLSLSTRPGNGSDAPPE